MTHAASLPFESVVLLPDDQIFTPSSTVRSPKRKKAVRSKVKVPPPSTKLQNARLNRHIEYVVELAKHGHRNAQSNRDKKFSILENRYGFSRAELSPLFSLVKTGDWRRLRMELELRMKRGSTQ